VHGGGGAGPWVPGQSARLTLFGTAGERVALLVDAITITALSAT
jgi:hypothetical protein